MLHYLLTLLGGLHPTLVGAAQSDPSGPRFNRDIRPILSEKCYACHGPDRAKRKADLRLDLADEALASGVLTVDASGQSELVRRTHSSADSERMPPPESRKQLTSRERSLLAEWIAAGAPYEDHWSYLPLQRPPLPPAPADSTLDHPIDRLLLIGQQAQGIAPAALADQRTLLRRLSLDLIGLPPTPAEMERFLADNRSDAYEREVDRLFASPHYGERMASFWLDLARYADTVGYHGDQNINVFPYRDYVIQAFQQNLPFDRFTIEQLAGDLLPAASEQSRVATAFLRLNMVTREGGAQPKEYLAKYAADRVRTISTTWLGSTMGCAECHDHKYDPFTTRDFYSLAAFFADIQQWGVYQDYEYTPNPDLRGWSNDHPFPPEIEVISPTLQARAERIEQEIEALLEYATRLCVALQSADHPEADREPTFEDWAAAMQAHLKREADGWLVPEGRLVQRPEAPAEKRITAELLPDRSLLLTGGALEPVTLRIALPAGTLAALRLELLPDPTHAQSVVRGGGERTWVTLGAKYCPPGGAEPVALNFHHADADFREARYGNGHEVLGIRGGWSTAREQAGQRQCGVWQLATPLTALEGAELEVTLAHGSVGRPRLAIAPIAAPELLEQHLATACAGDQAIATYLLSSGAYDELRSKLQEKLRALRECRGGKARVVVAVPCEPALTRVLSRGNWQDESGAIVEPALPACLAGAPTSAARRQNRLDLARWLVSRENPLGARTFVNRLWQQFFGRGLSAVIDDLGSQGEWPVQVELLDWLACEFIDSGWDVQHVLRLMLTSQAYRRDSSSSPEEYERDPDNRWLARQLPRRLDAEFVRDQALFVAGILNEEIGGPSCFPYQPPGYYANLQFPDRDYKADSGSAQRRRGLYMHWQRTFLHPMLANFDAPSREECTAARVVSNTPQQALTLLNDPSFLEAARALAQRTFADPQATDAQRLRLMYAWVLNREPKEAELQGLLSYLEVERRHYAADQTAAQLFQELGNLGLIKASASEVAAWTNCARVLLNLHETITRY